MKQQLFSDNEDQDNALNVNEKFKEKFEHNERRKHLHKAEEKYGKAAVEAGEAFSSSEDESSGIDEDAIANQAEELKFIETIAKIRAGDKTIFEQQ